MAMSYDVRKSITRRPKRMLSVIPTVTPDEWISKERRIESLSMGSTAELRLAVFRS